MFLRTTLSADICHCDLDLQMILILVSVSLKNFNIGYNLFIFFSDFVHAYIQCSSAKTSNDICQCDLDLQMTLTLVSVSLKTSILTITFPFFDRSSSYLHRQPSVWHPLSIALVFNPIAPRSAKTEWSFGRS